MQRTTVILALLAVVVAAFAAPALAGTARSTAATVAGNPANGKKIFATAGCAGCHTLKAAKATGKVGPNLDKLKPAYAKVVTQVTKGGGTMPAFKGRLTTSQIQDVAAFVYTSTH